MSFETDNNQRNTEEQSLDQNAIENKTDQNNKENDLNRIVDVAMGTYYYRKFLLVVMLFFVLFVLSSILRNTPYGSLIHLLYNIIFNTFGLYFFFNSMIAFYHVPEEIIPKAKSTIIQSWVSWLIFIGIVIVFGVILPKYYIIPHYLMLTTFQIIVINISHPVCLCLAFYSLCIFTLFLLKLKQHFVPGNASGKIIFTATIIVLLLLAISSPIDPIAILAVVFFTTTYCITHLLNCYKLYHFFSKNYDYTELKKEYATKSRFSLLFIVLFVISAIGLITLSIP